MRAVGKAQRADFRSSMWDIDEGGDLHHVESPVHTTNESIGAPKQAPQSQLSLLENLKQEDEDGYESPLKVPSSVLGKVFFFITAPLQVSFFLLIPNTENPTFEKWYVLSFLMSIAFITG